MIDRERRSALGKLVAAATAPLAAPLFAGRGSGGGVKRPNVLIVMTDQQRFDTIAALGNRTIYTPNIDRLVRRGIAFTNAYTPCPECVPARYSIRTGCEPQTTGYYANALEPTLAEGQAPGMTDRCGPYLPQVMKALGYRTFGIGKFHTNPWNESLGFDVHLHAEEWYLDAKQRNGDAYASWLAAHHPEFSFIEQLMGERTEMYYMPQASPLPAKLTVEGWVAQQAVRQLAGHDGRPFFGVVSFVGPHPPFAPPIPFNRLYDPDRMPDPLVGQRETDFMDEEIPWMNHAVWAEEISVPQARILKARYYGLITYIDACIGVILDAIEQRADADDTLVCFLSDHGDHLGDHHAWQKESFFEPSCRVPFLVSWPSRLARDRKCDDLVSTVDLFGIVTGAAGALELREGYDVLGLKSGTPQRRSHLVSFYGVPGTSQFKTMVRLGSWKYIFIANGGREQLFDLTEDPHELVNLAPTRGEVRQRLRKMAVDRCRQLRLHAALDGDDLRALPFQSFPRQRIYQFDWSRGVRAFPDHPADVLKNWKLG